MPEDEAIALILDDYAGSKKWRDVVNKRNRRYRNIYLQKDDTPKVSPQKEPKAETTKRSKIYIPLGKAVVDTASSVLSRTIFSQPRYITIEPTEPEDEEHSAAFEDLFHWQAGRSQMNLKHDFRDQFLFQLCLYDMAVARVGWLIKRGYVPAVSLKERMVRLALWLYRFRNTAPRVVMVPKNNATDRPDVEFLDTLRCFPDAWATDFDDSRFFIYLSDTDIDTLTKQEKTKKNPWGVYQKVRQIEPNSYPGKEDVQKTPEKDKDEYERPTEEDIVERMNYHTPDAMVIVANRKWIIRKRRMPGYPFTKGTYCPLNHQWNGIGLMEAMEQLQIDVNQLVRLRRDNENYIVNAIAVINRALFPDHTGKHFKMFPGKTLFTRSGDPSKAVHWERPPDLTQTFDQQVNFHINMIERVTGIAENAQAVWRLGGRRTATEAGLIAQGLETRLGEIGAAIEEKNLVDIVHMVYNQNQLNLTDEVKFRILGKRGWEYRKIDKQSILHKGAFDVKPVGSKFAADKAMHINQFLQAVNIVAANPVFLQMTNKEELLKQIWTKLGQKDAERYLLDQSATDYRVPPEMENMLMASGERIEPGNQDNDTEHIASHTEFMETGQYPPENRFAFEEHIVKHQQRQMAMEQAGRNVQPLPQAPENVLGQPYQMFGGMRTPAGGGVEGGTPSPQGSPQGTERQGLQLM